MAWPDAAPRDPAVLGRRVLGATLTSCCSTCRRELVTFAISIPQLIPSAEILVVTTPQIAAAEVAERAGSISGQTRQRVIGVVENMSYLPQPDGTQLNLFGEGGGATVAARLSSALGYEVPLLAQVPLDVDLRKGGDQGSPVVLTDSPASEVLNELAKKLGHRARGLAGRQLGVTPK